MATNGIILHSLDFYLIIFFLYKTVSEKIYRASADTSDIFPNTGRKKLSTRTTAENEKAFSPGHSLCSECGK